MPVGAQNKTRLLLEEPMSWFWLLQMTRGDAVAVQDTKTGQEGHKRGRGEDHPALLRLVKNDLQAHALRRCGS